MHKNKIVSFRLTEEEFKKLKERANSVDRSVANLVRLLVVNKAIKKVR